MRYFKIIDSKRVVTVDDYTFKFDPAYRNAATGGSWGILQVEDDAAAEALAAVARDFGAFEIDESEYVQALQKKSSLNINLVKHNERSTQSAGRVEAKKAGETSSEQSAESIDDFMAGPKDEAPSEKDTSISDEPAAPEEPAAEEAPAPEAEQKEETPAPDPEPAKEEKPKPNKKRRTRKTKSKS